MGIQGGPRPPEWVSAVGTVLLVTVIGAFALLGLFSAYTLYDSAVQGGRGMEKFHRDRGE